MKSAMLTAALMSLVKIGKRTFALWLVGTCENISHINDDIIK